MKDLTPLPKMTPLPKNLMARNRGRSLSANQIKRLTEEDVERLLPDADLALPVNGNLTVMRTLDEVIGALEKRVKARIKLRPEFKLLLTVSGIGQILGLTRARGRASSPQGEAPVS